VLIPAHPADGGRAQPGPAAGWSDAATIVPRLLYERFGDLGVLRDQLASMQAHVDLVAREAGPNRLWDDGFQFGDWLDPTAPENAPYASKTDPDLLATAYFQRSAALLAETAELLGEDGLARDALGLADEIREAWVDEYVTPAGRTMSDSQTSYALAILFDLERDPVRRQKMGDRLASLVRQAAFTIGTGMLGTPHVAPALTATGHLDIAARLLLQTRYPSWLFPVTMGATTIWERWDSLRPDGSINPSRMTSFNHYVLGSVADWLHSTIAGLSSAAPGYRKIMVAPHPIAGLHHARAALVTPYGRTEVGWEAGHLGRIEVTALIPPNCTATVRLHGRAEEQIGSGRHCWQIEDVRGEPPQLYGLETQISHFLNDPLIATRVSSALRGEEATKMMGGMIPGTSVRRTFHLETPGNRERLAAEFPELL